MAFENLNPALGGPKIKRYCFKFIHVSFLGGDQINYESKITVTFKYYFLRSEKKIP